MSSFYNEKVKSKNTFMEETDLSTSSGLVITLLKTVKAETKTYEEKLEAYYKELYGAHQAEQKLFKTKRQLIKIMKEKNVDQLSTEEDLGIQLVRSHAKVIIHDDSLIPPQYITVKRIVDNEKLRKALHSGQSIPGVRLDMEAVEAVVELDARLICSR